MAVEELRFRYHGADGVALAGFKWVASGKPRALLQLAHGAGEHSGRYRDRLAAAADAGFLIYAADHRGHGLTSGMSHLGDFGAGGAEECVADMARLSELARAENPGLPLVLMGHSMGAIFAQAYLEKHSNLIDGLVLSGTTGSGPRLEGGPNSVFSNPRTDYDWLSRDNAEVDRYIADPFCGIRFNDASQASFQTLAARALASAGVEKLRAGLPVYVFVGDQDPINNRLQALMPLIAAYKAAGLNVALKIYANGRHEMLNETNRDEVVSDLLAWLHGWLESVDDGPRRSSAL